MFNNDDEGNTFDIRGMASDTELQPGLRYVKTGESNNGDSLYEDFVPCFTLDAMVSPYHRMLIAAKHLVGLPGIEMTGAEKAPR